MNKIISVSLVAATTLLTGFLVAMDMNKKHTNKPSQDLNESFQSITTDFTLSDETQSLAYSDINFQSAKDVEKLSKSKIVSFVNSNLRTTDFIDLVCVPDNVGKDEYIFYFPLNATSEINLTEEFPADIRASLIKEHNQEVSGGDETAQYVLYKETTEYTEYRINFDSNFSAHYNTDDMENKASQKSYRVIYPKHKVVSEDHTPYFTGEISLKSVSSCLDLEFGCSSEPVLYREYLENDSEIICTFYNITKDVEDTMTVEEPLRIYALLNKNTVKVNKETHEMARENENIKSVIID